MPKFTRSSVDAVRDAVDMVDLVSARTELRKAGQRSYTGICPFHEERSPSFSVEPIDKLYHCFGCQKSGNAVGFLMVIAAGGWKSLTAALLVAGVGNQVMRPTNASLISKRTTHGQGVSISIMDSFDSLGRIIGPILAGSLYGPGGHYPYLAAAGVLLLCRLTLWRRVAPTSRRVEEGAPPVDG